jgi:hypothetical protein
VNRGIALYRLLTALWFALLVAGIYFADSGPTSASVACISLAAALILFQTVGFRCNTCGTRPGLWLLAVWTLLLDYELYIADVILLRKCPKCGTVFKPSTPELVDSRRAA